MTKRMDQCRLHVAIDETEARYRAAKRHAATDDSSTEHIDGSATWRTLLKRRLHLGFYSVL